MAAVLVAGLGAGAAAYLLDDPGTDRVDAGSDVQAGSQDQACGERRFVIAAAPRIAATVRRVVSAVSVDPCLSVGVRSVPSVRTAADVGREEGKGLGGSLPDAWMPDSTLWLATASASQEGSQRLDGDGESVASSPVVLATTPDRAATLGWPDAPEWEAALTTDPAVTLALPDLDRDAAALTALPAIKGARSLPELSRLVAAPPLAEGESLDLVLSGDAELVPSTEQEVATAGSGEAVALYDTAFGQLDFPLVRVRPLGAEDDQAADAVFDAVAEALTGEEGQAALAAAGFRAAGGEAGDGAPNRDGVDYGVAPGEVAVDSGTVEDVHDQWATQGRRSRLLLLMDLSGSMAETLPDGQTRAQAAQEALRGLVDGASPDDALGLWGFTTEVGNGDFEVLLPARPLETSVDGSSLRSTFLAQVDRLEPVPGGSTSLYDTLAAAYTSASRRYVDGRFNAVVLVTDGRNEDPGSRSLPVLLDEVRRQFDGARPVRIITVAYGEGADAATLRSIADATAGRSYQALDAEQVQQRLLAALAQL